MTGSEKRMELSKQWAALKNFDKAVESYTRELENKIALLEDRKRDLISTLKAVKYSVLHGSLEPKHIEKVVDRIDMAFRGIRDNEEI